MLVRPPAGYRAAYSTGGKRGNEVGKALIGLINSRQNLDLFGLPGLHLELPIVDLVAALGQNQVVALLLYGRGECPGVGENRRPVRGFDGPVDIGDVFAAGLTD